MTRKSTFPRSPTHMTSEFGDRNGCGLSGMTKPHSLWSLEAATYGASTRSLPLLRTLRRLSPTTIDTMCRNQNLQGGALFRAMAFFLSPSVAFYIFFTHVVAQVRS